MDFASFQKKLAIFWKAFYEKGGYTEVLVGLKNTMLIAVIGLVIGIVIGTVIAAVAVQPRKNIWLKILNRINEVYVGFFRGTPMVVQLLLGYFVILPIFGLNFAPVKVATVIMGLNSGAYVSEIMRSGILSVDIGQMEAGRALGFRYGMTMWKIIIPQAVKNILPTLGNEFISLVKETSVVSFVGAVDLYKAFRSIGSGTYEYMIPFLAMAIIYIAIIMIITLGINLMERRLRSGDKR